MARLSASPLSGSVGLILKIDVTVGRSRVFAGMDVRRSIPGSSATGTAWFQVTYSLRVTAETMSSSTRDASSRWSEASWNRGTPAVTVTTKSGKSRSQYPDTFLRGERLHGGDSMRGRIGWGDPEAVCHSPGRLLQSTEWGRVNEKTVSLSDESV